MDQKALVREVSAFKRPFGAGCMSHATMTFRRGTGAERQGGSGPTRSHAQDASTRPSMASMGRIAAKPLPLDAAVGVEPPVGPFLCSRLLIEALDPAHLQMRCGHASKKPVQTSKQSCRLLFLPEAHQSLI